MNLTDPSLNGQPFLQIPRVIQIQRSLRIVWLIMLFSMGWISYVFFNTLQGPLTDPALLTVAAAIFVLCSFLLPDWLCRKLRPGPGPGPSALEALLGVILINHIFRFALTEGALILLLMAYHNSTAAFCFYGAACGLMVFHFPTDSRFESLARA